VGESSTPAQTSGLSQSTVVVSRKGSAIEETSADKTAASGLDATSVELLQMLGSRQRRSVLIAV
jgi:hypothetical protein